MKSYVIEFNGSGETCEGYFSNETEAALWVESVLEQRGYNLDTIESGQWLEEGQNDDGETCYFQLFWEEGSAPHETICKLCRVGE